MPDNAYVISDSTGVLELLLDVQAHVSAGQALAAVHSIERIGSSPALYRAPIDGWLIGRAHGCLVRPGDFLAMIAQEA